MVKTTRSKLWTKRKGLIMKKFIVSLEFKVVEIELLDIEVEAETREDAIKLAEQKYIDNPNEGSMYASDFREVHLDVGNMDIIVEDITDGK